MSDQIYSDRVVNEQGADHNTLSHQGNAQGEACIKFVKCTIKK